MLMPSEIHAAALAALPACDIDHHASDLYVRVTPASRAIINRYQYRQQVTTFIDNIEGVAWYEVPFCYIDGLTKEGNQ